MNKLLKDILKEQIQIKGLNLERIREQTGIVERHLAALLDGDKGKLPPAPYVRGVLFKIALVLDLNGQELWEIYKSEIVVKRSGPADRLPENRFALKKIKKGSLIAGAVAVLIVIYGAINANRFLGRPQIKIANPSVETLVTTANTINLLGTVELGSKLTIDGEETVIDSNGDFEKEYSLKPGLNRIEFSVKRLLSREAIVTRQVIYQPQPTQ